MKKKLFVFSIIVFPLFLSAQKEFNIWYFGDHAGLDFSSGNPVALTNGQLSTVEGCATVSDKNSGTLLFYTDGVTVWNKNHAQMPNGFDLKGSFTTTQSATIVSQSCNNSIYYLFTVGAQAGYYGSQDPKLAYAGLAYSIVDMSLNGGLGDVTTKNQDLLTPTDEKLTAVTHSNGTDIWIISHKWQTDSLYAYLLTAAGINSTPVGSKAGVVHTGTAGNERSIGYLQASPDGKKLACAIRYACEIYDFDNNTGKITNAIIDSSFTLGEFDRPYGVCFSPDNSKLYISALKIVQYDMLAGTNAAILASRTEVGSFNGSAMQLAPDGKIYIAKGYDDSLGVINNPNAAGVASGCLSAGVFLNGKLSTGGLPNTVVVINGSSSAAEFTYDSNCFGSQTRFTNTSAANGNVKWFWDFGDNASGTMNMDSTLSPSHLFSDTGLFTVKLFANGGLCQLYDTAFQYIHIEDCKLFIPNAFTPNSDGMNDAFTIHSPIISEFKMLICDRWGNKIFETNDINNGWDGKYKSKNVQEDVYLYSINIVDFKKEKHQYIGRVTVIR